MANTSLVRPTLEYASLLCDPHFKGDVKKLEKVQRKAARYVLGKHKKMESVSEMLRVLGWERLQERTKRSRLCGMFRIMSGERAWKEFERI